ncbi:MAG: hypothetical protein KDE32_01745 [Novosphingobium sp.]|nr:hypothetical protein [Novosphingobium sp.]
MSLSLALACLCALLVGGGLGLAHFGALGLITRYFVEGRTGPAIGLQVGRMLLLALVLAATAIWLGALPLLACFAGLLVGRWIALRRAREQA